MISSMAWRRRLVFAGCLLAAGPLRAQDPVLTPDNLAHTQETIANVHLINRVSLRVGQRRYVQYRCDRYPDVTRITEEDGTTYAWKKGKAWLRSKDWGDTGTKANEQKVRELETEADAMNLPFVEFTPHDMSQGALVWRFIERKKEGDTEWFTYERSRERPRPDGEYPRFTFVKYKSDADGKLLLSFYTAQMHAVDWMHAERELVPVEIKFDYLIPLPAGTKVEVVPAKPPRKDGK